MSADKLKAVHEALAGVFDEANLNATGTVIAQTSFDHGVLSEAFSKPHLNAANTEQSFARFDHTALTGLFSEPRSERPIPTSFDQAFAETLSERSALNRTHAPRPGFDQQAFAEMLNEPAPISTKTNPSQPSFDHQALAEMLTEAHADPIDPPSSTLSLNPDSLSSSASLSDQGEHEEPVVKAFTAATPADAESARPPIAKSLLAKLHHIFSTKEQPSLPVIKKDPLPQPFPLPSNPEAIARGSSAQPEKASPHSAGSTLANLRSLGPQQAPISPRISGQPVNGKPSASDAIGSPPSDAVGMWLRHASSLPNEETSPTPINTESSSPTFERYPSTATASYEFENVDQEAEAAAVSAPPEAGSATERQTRSFRIEPEAPNSKNSEPVLPIFGDVRSDPLLPDSLANEDVELAEGPEQLLQPQAGPPPLIFSMPTGSAGLRAASWQPILSDQSDSDAPAEDIVSATALSEAENGPSQLPGLFAELAPAVSTHFEPPPHFQTERSSEKVSARANDMTSAARPVSPSPPTNVENAHPQRLQRLLAELAPTSSSNPTPTAKKDPTPAAFSDQAEDPQPAVKAASPSASAEVQPWVTERLLSEILSPASSNAKSHCFIFENETSPRSFSGGRDVPGPAIDRVAPTLPTHATAEQSRSLPLTDLAALVSTDTRSSGPAYEQNALGSSPLRRPESVEPSVSSLAAPNEAENALPEHESPLLTALDVLSTKPSPPLVEKKPSASTVSSQPDIAEIPMKPMAHPTHLENALAHPPKSLMPEMSATATDANFSIPVFEEERRRLPVLDQPANEVPTTKAGPAAVASSPDTDSVVTQAQHASSLLEKLDLNTAIQLRWTMRDIRGKRTKLSPVSDNHLTTLMDLGLVEMRDGLPRLTGLGILALD
jgi:hypothetical protein